MIGPDLMMWLDENFGPANYGLRLQDYTDNQIVDLIKAKLIKSRESLITELLNMSEIGTDRYAHLLGFRSAADRQHILDAIETEKQKMKEV